MCDRVINGVLITEAARVTAFTCNEIRLLVQNLKIFGGNIGGKACISAGALSALQEDEFGFAHILGLSYRYYSGEVPRKTGRWSGRHEAEENNTGGFYETHK